MCGNPAGRLDEGYLDHPTAFAQVDLKLSTLGTLVGGGGTGAVATIHCIQDEQMRDYVVFYSSTGKILGHYDIGSLGTTGRALVEKVRVSSGIATVHVRNVSRADDGDWGSTSVKLRFDYRGRTNSMKLRDATWYTENETAENAWLHVKNWEDGVARGFASKSVVSGLHKLAVEDRKKNVWVTVGKCYGYKATGSARYLRKYIPNFERGCLYTLHNKTWVAAKGAYQTTTRTYLARMKHTASDPLWTTWRAYGWKRVK